jgi:hypothetical protein
MRFILGVASRAGRPALGAQSGLAAVLSGPLKSSPRINVSVVTQTICTSWRTLTGGSALLARQDPARRRQRTLSAVGPPVPKKTLSRGLASGLGGPGFWSDPLESRETREDPGRCRIAATVFAVLKPSRKPPKSAASVATLDLPRRAASPVAPALRRLLVSGSGSPQRIL